MNKPRESDGGAASGRSWAGLDPRTCVVAAVCLGVTTVWFDSLSRVLVVLAVAVPAAFLAPIPLGQILRKLIPLNVFMLFMILVVPLSTPGSAWLQIGPFSASREGIGQALLIAAKGNAVMLWAAALLGPLEANVLGHALHHLRLPRRLVQLLLFTIRYIDVLEREYRRLRTAMRARGFRPRLNRHTYRSYGYLIGMLLVRSLDRSERILAAMKCRGFQGEFYVLDHFRFSGRDAVFAAGFALFLTLLLCLGPS